MIAQFRKDVLEGLSNTTQKKIDSKYFYDKKGDELFVRIMAMPEYYLTAAEMDIFKNKTGELISSLEINKNEYFEIIELGAGDGTKTIELLKALKKENYRFGYIPVDISQNALNGLQAMLKVNLPDVEINIRQGDYFNILGQLKSRATRKIILFLGSNIGNLTDEQAGVFIYQLGANLKAGDKMLLGVDLKKEKNIVLPAYDDAQGITKAFNLNLLDRINRELEADFDLEQFNHLASYEEDEGIARSYIQSKIKQVVTINALHMTFNFEAGETIHTEVSRKYDDAIMTEILRKTDFTIEAKITDSKGLFADYVLKRN